MAGTMAFGDSREFSSGATTNESSASIRMTRFVAKRRKLERRRWYRASQSAKSTKLPRVITSRLRCSLEWCAQTHRPPRTPEFRSPLRCRVAGQLSPVYLTATTPRRSAAAHTLDIDRAEAHPSPFAEYRRHPRTKTGNPRQVDRETRW